MSQITQGMPDSPLDSGTEGEVVTIDGSESANEQQDVTGRVQQMSDEKVQEMRWNFLGAKGGDGDPPYALDRYKLGMRSQQKSMTADGRYRREGD